MKQLFRFVIIVFIIVWFPLGVGIGINGSWLDPELTIFEKIFSSIGVLGFLMALCLAARWCNKGKNFDIAKDSLYVFKHIVFGILIFFSIGLIGLLLGACKKFFSF